MGLGISIMSNPFRDPPPNRIFRPDNSELGRGERVFGHQFTPEIIHFRGQEIEQLTTYFNPQRHRVNRGVLPIAILSGSVGSGKHLVTKAVARNFTSFLPHIGESFPVSIECRMMTLRGIIAKVSTNEKIMKRLKMILLSSKESKENILVKSDFLIFNI